MENIPKVEVIMKVISSGLVVRYHTAIIIELTQRAKVRPGRNRARTSSAHPLLAFRLA
jgi:hypothetical protein